MTQEQLQAQLTDYGALVSSLKGLQGGATSFTTLSDQYNPAKHDVANPALRQDKTYTTDTGATALSLVSRLVLPFQKQIVGRAATFLCGNPIEIKADPTDDQQKRMLAAIKKVWDDCKLDYKSKTLAKHMFAETETAELWYVEPVEEGELYWTGVLADTTKFKLRMRILAQSLGDMLYPVFSPTGDMIAFGRGYNVALEGSKLEEHFDLYTAENIHTSFKDINGNWVVTNVANEYKKIPVIYYRQAQAEWADVQTLIDRYEKQLSNLADTNDYFGSPMLAVTGKVTGMATKGESGKTFELEAGASMSYVTWSQAPESVKLEMETLLKNMYACTDTPNISFEEMKSLGVYSGIALKMLFLGAHMKASDKEEIFGEGIQRRLNYIKSVIQLIDVTMSDVRLSLKPKFEYFLPKNDVEKIQTLVEAVNGKIMSVETAVAQNPLVEDAPAELQKLEAEATAADSLNETFA